MKGRVRGERRLRAKDIGALKPGWYEDGLGLRLLVTPSGSRRWIARLTVNGRRVNRGLGGYPSVGLEDAREAAHDLRRAARRGVDLAAEQRRERARSVSFREAFDSWFELKKDSLTDLVHVRRVPVAMARYVHPFIGDMRVSDVKHADVLDVLRSIWHTKPQLARRLLQRMDAVFKSAILRGQRVAASPCEGIAAELGENGVPVEHRLALPYSKLPAFLKSLRACTFNPVAVLCLEFLVLCAVRSKEARGARWPEINQEAASWTIAAPRMKGRRAERRAHTVPLAPRCLAILKEARALNPAGELVFPGEAGVLSGRTFGRIIADLGLADRCCAHGMRSSFKDWAAETGVRDEVSEACLAHTDTNKVRAAYRRTTFDEERRRVMDAWAAFCERGRG